MARRGQLIDWQKVEVQYRAGALSLRAIAAEHGIAESAIRKRAGRDKWERDLTEKVNQKVRRELVRIEVRKHSRTSESTMRTEAEEVERAARGPIAAIARHRSMSERAMEMASTLMDQLALAIGDRETFQVGIEELTNDDKSNKRYNALMRAVALPTHITAMKDVALAVRTLAQVERQAYGLADVEDPTPPVHLKDVAPADDAMAKFLDRQQARIKKSDE